MRHIRGFSLIELMVVVVIVTILAVVAVGAYRKYIIRARSMEVYAMLAEIRTKEESYRAENGRYLNLSSGETDGYPALVNGSEPYAKVFDPSLGTPWRQLGVKPPGQQVYCSYAVVADVANSWGNSGGRMQTFLRNTLPQTAWWAAVATCDHDAVPGTISDGNNAVYITSSQTTLIYEENQTR